MDVSHNKIKRLSTATLQRIDNYFAQPKKPDDYIRKINLLGNPYVCDCNLRPMFDWLSNTQSNLHRRDEMRCYTGIPDINAGRKILNVGELDCLDKDLIPHNLHSGNGITHTLLVILIILILVLLGALLYIHKEKVQSNVKPLIDNFQRSLQYRTIEKDLAESTQIPPEVNV